MRWLLLAVTCCVACVPRSVSRGATAVAVGSIACDWSQTRSMASDGWGYMYETNAILGETPSTGSIDAYMALMTAGVVAVSEVLSPSAALALDGLVLGVEVHAIGVNRSLGLPLCR